MRETWIRFEGTRQQNSVFGTIDKEGRLLIRNAMAQELGILPNTHVEVYYQPDVRKIGMLPVPEKTPYSLKVNSTGRVGDPFDQETPYGSLPQAYISLRSFLNTRRIGLASKIRGELYWDTASGMLIFELPKAPQIIQPSDHVAAQLESVDAVDRVIGDTGTAPNKGETE
jgi:hypothetical protein